MNVIIKELTRALQKVTVNQNGLLAEALVQELRESGFSFVKALPISIVHTKEKLKESDTSLSLTENDFFDDAGYSRSAYDRSLLTRIYHASKSSFQAIDLAVLAKESKLERLEFQSKRPNDFWKRLQNIEAVEAMIGLQHVESSRCSDGAIEREVKGSSSGQWGVESELRDAMRSKKENSGLRMKPFIWVVTKERTGGPVDNVGMLLHHYFGGNVVHGEGVWDFYIGYMETLNGISLREFYKKA